MNRSGPALDGYTLEAVAVAAAAWLAAGMLRAELDLIWQSMRLLLAI